MDILGIFGKRKTPIGRRGVPNANVLMADWTARAVTGRGSTRGQCSTHRPARPAPQRRSAPEPWGPGVDRRRSPTDRCRWLPSCCVPSLVLAASGPRFGDTHDEQPGARDHEGEQADHRNRRQIQASEVSAEQQGSTHDFDDVKPCAADEPVGSKPNRAFTAANRLDVAVDVDDRGHSRDDEPLESYRSMILTAHQADTADHEDGSEPGECANGSVAMRWVVRDDADVE